MRAIIARNGGVRLAWAPFLTSQSGLGGGGAAPVRVGTASQPASVVAESAAASGELDLLTNEIAKLRRENAKLQRNMDKLATYSYGRYSALSAEAKEVQRLYEAARENCSEHIVLPAAPAVESQEPLRGAIFERMYAQSKVLTIDETDDEDEHSQNLDGFKVRDPDVHSEGGRSNGVAPSEGSRSKKSARTDASGGGGGGSASQSY